MLNYKIFLKMVQKNKDPIAGRLTGPVFWYSFRQLFADTKLFLGDDSAVAVDVFLNEVVEKTTTLTYESLKSASCCIIFVI